MMTIPQARKIVGQQLGFTGFDGSVDAYRNLTPQQQIDLTKALFNYIKANPGNFTDAQQQTVAAEDSRIQKAVIEDASITVGNVMTALEESAYNVVAEPLMAVGQGVSTSVKLIGTLLPAAVIIAAVLFALPYLKKASS